MRKFLLKISAISFIVVLIFFVMFIFLPMDKDDYMREYNKKIEILKTTSNPRMIFIGASTLAFGIDSKQISDSLGMNVINMGLHAGIGARYYIDDYLQYIRKGDIVLLCPSYYADFIEGGNGFPESLPDLMIATNWRNFERLNINQVMQLIKGVPFYCLRSSTKLFKTPEMEFDPSDSSQVFQFKASGFNEYGDEVSHWTIPSALDKDQISPNTETSTPKNIKVNNCFLIFLKNSIEEYKRKGAYVMLMPEISSHKKYLEYNPIYIQEIMKKHNLFFLTNPKHLEFHDSCSYDEWGGAHLSRLGVTIASKRIVALMREKRNPKGELVKNSLSN